MIARHSIATEDYAFQVDDDQLDHILARVKQPGLTVYAGLSHWARWQAQHRSDGRGFTSRPNDRHRI